MVLRRRAQMLTPRPMNANTNTPATTRNRTAKCMPPLYPPPPRLAKRTAACCIPERHFFYRNSAAVLDPRPSRP